jgi:hypothetical protein
MGHLLFVREGTLMAQPFDSKRLELAGEAVPIAEQVATSITRGAFSVSTTGVRGGLLVDSLIGRMLDDYRVLAQIGNNSVPLPLFGALCREPQPKPIGGAWS